MDQQTTKKDLNGLTCGLIVSLIFTVILELLQYYHIINIPLLCIFSPIIAYIIAFFELFVSGLILAFFIEWKKIQNEKK